MTLILFSLATIVGSVGAATVPSVPLLGTGARFPMVGLGLCCRASASGDAVRQSVLEFLLMGGRHLDDAEVYNNHREVGQGVREAITRGVPREEIFFTTKVDASRFGFEGVTEWVPKMLADLQMDYVDLVLLHWAGEEKKDSCGSARTCRQEAWLALQRFVRSGQIRNLGVSNFGPRQIAELQGLNSMPVAVNQLEYHPWAEDTHLEAVAFCHQHGIAITAYGSMGSNKLVYQLMNDGVMKQLAEMHGKTVGQILLRWAVQKNVTVIPGTGNPEHMKENLDVFDFELSGEAMEFLDGRPGGQKFNLFGHVPDKIV